MHQAVFRAKFTVTWTVWSHIPENTVTLWNRRGPIEGKQLHYNGARGSPAWLWSLRFFEKKIGDNPVKSVSGLDTDEVGESVQVRADTKYKAGLSGNSTSMASQEGHKQPRLTRCYLYQRVAIYINALLFWPIMM